ncbi:MAG: hypothetical protein GXN93_04990 [Candidatus Diapherotrites archaeon]|nr:hypothetical protein [Candidatus Diapherotrites archaeon]
MRRGIEGVFQLLIGVFTAAMIVAVAYRVLGQVQMNRCHENWQDSAVQLANAIGDAARASDATNFVQIAGRCGSARYVTYRIVTYSGAKICNAVCHKPVPTCYSVQYTAYSGQGGKFAMLDRGHYCLDISPYTYYRLQQSTREPCTSSGVRYHNVTQDLLDGEFNVQLSTLSAYVRATGYGTGKLIFVCAQGD